MYDEETVNLRVNRPFYIDFGCHTHIVNDALTFCTILTKFNFFYKKSLILSENRDFGEKSKIRITICITIYSKNSAKK